jgi:hypothetical protein
MTGAHRRRAAHRLVMALLLLGCAPARADVQVSGPANSPRLALKEATLVEVLAALEAEYGWRYQAPANLDRRISGTFEGAPRLVLTRLLDRYRYNFVIRAKEHSNAFEVIIVHDGAKSAAVTPPPPPRVPAVIKMPPFPMKSAAGRREESPQASRRFGGQRLPLPRP